MSHDGLESAEGTLRMATIHNGGEEKKKEELTVQYDVRRHRHRRSHLPQTSLVSLKGDV